MRADIARNVKLKFAETWSFVHVANGVNLMITTAMGAGWLVDSRLPVKIVLWSLNLNFFRMWRSVRLDANLTTVFSLAQTLI